MCMSYDVKLAKELKKRNNPRPSEPLLGDVISVEPLKIAIMNNQVILTDSLCYLCSNLVSNSKGAAFVLDSVADHGSVSTNGTITYSDILKAGDKVMCVPTAGGQKYFIVDKIL